MAGAVISADITTYVDPLLFLDSYSPRRLCTRYATTEINRRVVADAARNEVCSRRLCFESNKKTRLQAVRQIEDSWHRMGRALFGEGTTCAEHLLSGQSACLRFSMVPANGHRKVPACTGTDASDEYCSGLDTGRSRCTKTACACESNVRFCPACSLSLGCVQKTSSLRGRI